MSRFLFLFTIGPVQTFIAQARKIHDLYTGSRLLSDLVGYAIERLPQDKELIFPTPSHKDFGKTLNSMPNEFMALIHCDDPRETGENLKREVQNKFKTIVNDDVITKQGLSKPNGLDRQIEDFPEVYWAAIQFNDGDNYHEKYKQLTRLMGAVKNTRTFKQLPEEGRKCSLCGERNALFYKPNIDENGFEKRPKYIDDNAIKINDTRMARGEALCGICFVKRYYWKDDKEFPSTAGIALSYVLENLMRDDNEFSNLFQEYKGLFKYKDSLKNGFDEELCYEESLTKKYFIKYDWDTENLDNNKIIDINKKLRERIEKLNETKQLNLRLSRYYAIICLDGDDMGKRLSGEGLKEGISLLQFHKALSTRLGNFAVEASKYLDAGDKAYGRCVYAGGDDFLGFVNLRRLFEVMGHLRTSFDEMVNLPLKEDFLKRDLTISAGIVVAHYKTPLREVLNYAREMLELTKGSNSEKNAFCIAVLKRSGEVEQAVCKWDLNGLKSVEIMKAVVDALENKSFSNTFIKQLAMEIYGLMDQEGSFITGRGLEKKILEAEIKRLVARSCILKNRTDETGIIKLSSNLYNLYNISYNLLTKGETQNFVSLLNILDFIVRKW